MFKSERFVMASLEMLDKENDLSFDVSILDSIPLNNSATLDSLEATFSFLTEDIKPMQDAEQVAKKGTTQKPKRFAIPLSTKQIESLSTKFVLKKTADSTKWAIRIFTDWVQEKNRCLTNCPADLFDYTKVTSGHNGQEYGYPLSLLHFWLAAFVTEVRKADGGFYSPASLNSILVGLFRYMKEKIGLILVPFCVKQMLDFQCSKKHLTDS